MIFITLIRPQHLWNHEDDTMFLRRIGTVRDATVNMLANADFYGRRGVVVQKSAGGFKFSNPGSMRVSLNEAQQDSLSGIKSNRDKVLTCLVHELHDDTGGSGAGNRYVANRRAEDRGYTEAGRNSLSQRLQQERGMDCKGGLLIAALYFYFIQIKRYGSETIRRRRRRGCRLHRDCLKAALRTRLR